MPPQEDKSYIDELKKSLYSRTAPDVRTRRKLRYSDKPSDVQTSWEQPEDKHEEPVLNTKYEDASMSFFTKLLIGSVIFCVAAVGIGAYVFFNGANLISANNITINVNGPVSIPGGATVPFDIVVSNRNNIDLQNADLEVDFPDGSTDPSDSTKELKTVHQFIGDIPAGQSAAKTVSAIMFGEENLQKEITVTITYKVKGSTSVFTKNTTYDVLINSSPISMTVTAFKEITSGQQFDMKVTLKSNSQDTLKNVLLKASYPFGYTYLSSSVPPTIDQSTWKIGDIPPGASRTITLTGTLTGEDTDLRVFRFAVGAQSGTDPKSIGTEYMATTQGVTIQKPFISLGIAMNNDQSTGDYVGSFDRTVNVEVDWTNNLPTTVSNMQITAKLSGSAYDQGSVQASQGLYQSSSNQVTWNRQTDPELASVPGGASGKVLFSITPRNRSLSGGPTLNPTITVAASVSGSRTQELNVPQALTSAVSRNIKVASTVTLSGRTVRTVGPFTNTGPVPPKVDTPTTYTVIWDVDNTSSAVSNAKVTATLPAYVKWLNAFSPSNENVTYDSNSGTVTWNIGTVGTNTQGSSGRREVAFQVSFTPSVNQADNTPTLVNQATLSAVDGFTGATVTSTQDFLTTRFSTDPAYQAGQDTVTK